MIRARAGACGIAAEIAVLSAGILLAGCLADSAVKAPVEPGLCSDSIRDSSLIARRQPYIKGWKIPERAESGIPVPFSASVSDTCGLIRSRQWIFGGDTVAADDSNNATFAFPPIVDDSFPVAFIIRDADGRIRQQRSSLSVGSWLFRSESKYGSRARFLTESAGQYVYLATLQEYPDFYPVLLYLSRSGRLVRQVKVNKRSFDISAFIDNGDGTFIAAGGLIAGTGYASPTTSSPHVSVVNLDGSVLLDVDIPVAYGYTSVNQILRGGEGYMLALNQERPYESGTAVGSNYCPTINHYVKFGADWKEIGRRSDSSFACGMVSKALPDGGGGMVLMGYERTESPNIVKSFLVGVGPDLSMTVLDTARGEVWLDMQKVGGLYYILGGPAAFSDLAPPGAYLRTIDPASGARNRISLDFSDTQPSRLLYRDKYLFVAGVASRNGYGEEDDFFVYRLDLQGRVERKYTNRIADGAHGCDLAHAGNNSLLASLLLYQQQSIVHQLVVVNLDAEGRGVLK